jgi:hypothetical protein
VRALAIACALTLGAAATARPAFANGRFPRAERLREREDDPLTLVLAATYGLIVTNDGGARWHHLCELGYAFSIDELDPLVELAPDGALLATSAHALNRAPEPFCSFEPVLGGPGTETVIDYVLDPSDRRRVVAVRLQSSGGDVRNALFESLDAGLTFAPFGTPLPAEVAFVVTLDVAPSDANRLYASAIGHVEPGLLVRSEDGAGSFATFPLPVVGGEYPYLAAVHPRDSDVLYVRTDAWTTGPDGASTANDALLVSENGGNGFREVLRRAGKLFGFALSPDGSVVVAGYGDPVESGRGVEPSALGIYRASTADYAFTKIFDGGVSCLEWTARGLYVCTAQAERGFALGLAPDASFTLADEHPLTPVLDLAAVRGPLECPEGTSGAACVARWPENCALFEACGGGRGESGAAGETGAGGETGTGGTVPSSNAERALGCACRSARSGAPFGVLAAAFVALTVAGRRATRAAVRAACARVPRRSGARGTPRTDRARDRS